MFRGSDCKPNLAIVFAHLAFLARRALYVLDAKEREGKVVNPDYDIIVNDLSLPLWAAIAPRDAPAPSLA